MGTPDFAVESLKRIHESGYQVVGVVTMPDKPAGRGHKLQSSPVKLYALEHKLPLLQPERLKDEAFLAELRALKADLQIVVAFRMLPEVVWNMPPMGTFNLHASLLPQYRGAAPINWAIINGEKETGITTFFLTHEIDTGNIILQEKINIEANDNAEVVHDKLMLLGAELVVKTTALIQAGNVPQTPQPQNEVLKSAPKIFKDTCRIDWTQNSTEIYNFVRGLSPYPAAWAELIAPEGSSIAIKIFETKIELTQHQHPLAKLIIEDGKRIKIAVADGYVELKSVQLAGKKRMNADDLLRGHSLDGYSLKI